MLSAAALHNRLPTAAHRSFAAISENIWKARTSASEHVLAVIARARASISLPHSSRMERWVSSCCLGLVKALKVPPQFRAQSDGLFELRQSNGEFHVELKLLNATAIFAQIATDLYRPR